MAGSGGRVFGGQLLAQALLAAARGLETVRRQPVSVHGHFLAPGDAERPLDYRVHLLKEGRHFVVRRVDVHQGTQLIATMTATFHVPEPAPEHQVPAPTVEPPDRCPDYDPLQFGHDAPALHPVEVRLADYDPAIPVWHLWFRSPVELEDDPVLRAACILWFSDLALARTVDLPHQLGSVPHRGASLDHTVWFHRPADPRGWLLCQQTSEVYAGARGHARGLFFDHDGNLCATAAQECLIRRPASTKPGTRRTSCAGAPD